MKKREEVAALLQTAEAFLGPLRAGDGFREDEFRALCSALIGCAHAWRRTSTIPKLAANLLVDLFPALESLGHAYKGREAKKINDAAHQVADLVRECVHIDENPRKRRVPHGT